MAVERMAAEGMIIGLGTEEDASPPFFRHRHCPTTSLAINPEPFAAVPCYKAPMAHQSSSDLPDSWLHRSCRYLDLFSTAARRVTSPAPYAACRKVLLPLLQVLSLVSPEGWWLPNDHLPSNATGVSRV